MRMFPRIEGVENVTSSFEVELEVVPMMVWVKLGRLTMVETMSCWTLILVMMKRTPAIILLLRKFL